MTGDLIGRELVVPVRISGPFDALSYKPDLARAVEEGLRDKLYRRLEQATGGYTNEVEQQLRDGLNNALKGIFGNDR